MDNNRTELIKSLDDDDKNKIELIMNLDDDEIKALLLLIKASKHEVDCEQPKELTIEERKQKLENVRKIVNETRQRGRKNANN